VRSRIWVVGGIVAVAMLMGAADARAGWAGSRYEHSECTLNTAHGVRPSLYCETSVTQVEHNVTEIFGVADETCVSGLRLVQRTGTRITRFRVFDYYDGPVPLASFNFAGDEAGFEFEWVDVVETDLGCG
jgi:hypothetical protein